jgi:hypothetical protein
MVRDVRALRPGDLGDIAQVQAARPCGRQTDNPDREA